MRARWRPARQRRQGRPRRAYGAECAQGGLLHLAHRLPGGMAVHVFERAGHMLPQEIGCEIASLVVENTR